MIRRRSIEEFPEFLQNVASISRESSTFSGLKKKVSKSLSFSHPSLWHSHLYFLGKTSLLKSMLVYYLKLFSQLCCGVNVIAAWIIFKDVSMCDWNTFICCWYLWSFSMVNHVLPVLKQNLIKDEEWCCHCVAVPLFGTRCLFKSLWIDWFRSPVCRCADWLLINEWEQFGAFPS